MTLQLAECCCGGCAGAVAMRDGILAVDLELYTAVVAGQLELMHTIVADTIDFIYTNQFQTGCHDKVCCHECGIVPYFNCENFCDPPSLRRYVSCIPTDRINNDRLLFTGGALRYCPECQSAPEITCTCKGFPTTPFTSSGFNSRNSLSTGASGICIGQFGTETTVIASRLDTITTGDKTIEMRKSLRVGKSLTASPLYTNCITMGLAFQVKGHTTGLCADAGVNMSVGYQSVWNGSDTVLQYLSKPMHLQGISWNYDICPNMHPLNGDQNTCWSYDQSSFVDSTCGVCSASGYSIDYIETTFDKYMIASVCPPATLPTVIDPIFQPWIPPSSVYAI